MFKSNPKTQAFYDANAEEKAYLRKESAALGTFGSRAKPTACDERIAAFNARATAFNDGLIAAGGQAGMAFCLLAK